MSVLQLKPPPLTKIATFTKRWLLTGMIQYRILYELQKQQMQQTPQIKYL